MDEIIKSIMIRNFEDITHNLSDEELQIAQSVKNGLKKYVGKPNAKSGTTICSAYTKNTKHKLNGVRLRKIINFLRNQGEPICSNSKGYFYPANKQELLDTVVSIGQRIDSQLQILNQLKKHL
tara:strand:+ start:302 stop:670 length:369 start_codon:yes stop_codon:yes gene_type:complete